MKRSGLPFRETDPGILGACDTSRDSSRVPDAPPTASVPLMPSSDTYWIDDAVPAVGWTTGSQLVWDTTQKASGSQSMTTPYLSSSTTYVLGFQGLSQPLNPGDHLIAYVLLNPCAIPRELELRLQTNGGTTHAAAWWGTTALLHDETPGIFMGALPAAGVWTRLDIAASELGIEGATVWGITLCVELVGSHLRFSQ